MPPEVCKGQAYDAKADVWAMGVIIYELITLKKPFDGKSIEAVFDMIVNQQSQPLPEGTSGNLQLLVQAVLNKDKDKRPSIFEIAKIPCVNRKIEQFIQEKNCREEVMSFFDVEMLKQKNKGDGGGKKKRGGEKGEEIQSFVLE